MSDYSIIALAVIAGLSAEVAFAAIINFMWPMKADYTEEKS